VHAQLGAQVGAVTAALTARPEFAIRRIEVAGASPAVEAEIRAALIDVDGASSLALDAAALRRRIERLGWVESAAVSLEAPEVLRLSVVERVPTAVWRVDGEPWLIDAEGARIAALFRRDEFPHLPLVVGEGAERAVGEALALVHAAGPLRPRIRGLVRVGERRWDVVLAHDVWARDVVIRLPMGGGHLTATAPEASDPVAAMLKAVDFHLTEDLMNRDILVLDLRVPARPVVQLPPEVLDAFARQGALLLRGGRDA
jgi:cell division protein FtsQ